MSVENRTLFQCRICLNTYMNKYVSIFETYKEFSIHYYILAITNVEMKKDDGFPELICSGCLLELEGAVSFKQKCVKSDILLRNNKEANTKLRVDSDTDDKEIITVKKEEPIEIKIEQCTDGLDEYYEVNMLDDISEHEVKPFKSKAKDLKLECHDCGNLFKSKCKLRVHWKKTHMLSSLICDICKRRFKSYKAYHMHKKHKLQSCNTAGNKFVKIEGEGKSRIFHCTECKFQSKYVKVIQSHIVIHSGDRPCQCTLCPNRYTQLSSLQAHMESAHKKYFVEKPCHFCGKQLKGRLQVYRHMKTHTEAKKSCTICQKMVTAKSMKQHMQRHTGVKSFTCEKCASTFYTLSELCNHKRRVHFKVNNAFKCDMCDYTSSRQDRIAIHKKNHTDTNFSCTVCGMFFTSVLKLEEHQKRHYEEKNFECSYCDMKFYRKDSVGKHVRSKHKCILQVTNEKVPAMFKAEQIETDDLVVKINKKNKKV